MIILYILSLLVMLWVFRPLPVEDDYPEIVDAIKKDLG